MYRRRAPAAQLVSAAVRCRDRSGSWLQHQQPVGRARHPGPIAASGQLGWIELAGPRLGEVATELQAKAHGLDAGAALEQVAQHGGTQAVGAFDQLTRFLQRLPDADFAQHFQQCAFWRRDERGILVVLEGSDMKQGLGALVEQALAMVLGRKALGEPLRKAPGFPAIKVDDRSLGEVLAYAVPVERGLAADMQSIEAALQQDEALVQGGRIVRPAIDAPRQPLQPAGADIMDGEIGRYPQSSQVPGGQRRSWCQAGIKPI